MTRTASALGAMVATVGIALSGCFPLNTLPRPAEKLSDTEIIKNMARNYHVSPSDITIKRTKQYGERVELDATIRGMPYKCQTTAVAWYTGTTSGFVGCNTLQGVDILLTDEYKHILKGGKN